MWERLSFSSCVCPWSHCGGFGRGADVEGCSLHRRGQGPLGSPAALLRRKVFTLEGLRRAALGRGNSAAVTWSIQWSAHSVVTATEARVHGFGDYPASCGGGLETEMVGCQLQGWVWVDGAQGSVATVYKIPL